MQVNLNPTIHRSNFNLQHKQNLRPNVNQNTPSNINNTPSFTGINLRFLHAKADRAAANDFITRASYYLNVPTQKLRRFATPETPQRSELFYLLTENLLSDSQKANRILPENSELIIGKIFDSIKKPQETHFSLIKNQTYSFKDKEKILSITAGHPERLELLKQLQSLKGLNDYALDLSPETIISILTSDKTQKLSKNFEDFRSYIILNNKEKGFTENLMNELNKKEVSFNPEELAKKIALIKIHDKSIVLRELPLEFLEQNYNPTGLKLLSNRYMAMENLLPPKGEKLSPKDLEFFKYIINSTTKENYEIRKNFFVNNNSFQLNKNSNDEIMKFFKKVDSDKNFRKIYEYASKNSTAINSRPVAELMFYTDSFGSDVIAKKLKNFTKILSSNITGSSNPDEIVELLSKNLNNNFYITKAQIHQAKEDEYNTRINNMFFGNTKAKIKKAGRILSYEILPKLIGKVEVTPIKNKISYETYRMAASGMGEAVLQQPAKTVNIQETMLAAPKIKIKRDYKAMRLQITQEGQEIIKKKMRSKKDYGQNIKRYTKMRNAFLNEMFDSVKETRAQQRSEGIKRPNVSNADVIDLYSKIKGKNQKLVRCLLKQRTADGNREYTVKQISSILDEIEVSSKEQGIDQKAICDNLTKMIKDTKGEFKLKSEFLQQSF